MKLLIKKFLLILFILPFLVRLIYFFDTAGQPYFQKKILLSYINHNFAQDIVNGKGAPYLLFRSPYYPVLISFFYRMFGSQPLVIRLLQWLAGGIGCLIIYLMAKLYFGKREAYCAFLLASLYIPFVFFEGELIEQPLVTFFGLISIYLLSLIKSRAGNYLLASVSAFFFCILVLLRPDGILALPFILISICFFQLKMTQKLKIAGIFLIFASISVFLLKNPQLFLKLDENRIGINAAINFYIGNNPQSSGYSPVIPQIPELPVTHPEAEKYYITGVTLSGILYAKTQTNGDLSTISPFWMRKSIEFLKNDPLGFLYLEFKKFLLFFNGYLITNQKDIYVLRKFSYLLRFLVFNFLLYFPLGMIIPLFLTGLNSKNLHCDKLLLLCIPVSCLINTVLFFHSSRFIYPAVPFFIIFASAGIFRLYESFRQRNKNQVFKLLSIFTVGLVLSNIDFFGSNKPRFAQEYYNIANMYMEEGNTTKAKEFYLKSLHYDKFFEPSLINLGTIFKQTGKIKQGIEYFKKLYNPEQPSWAILYNITDFYYSLKDFQSALEWGKTLVEKNSENPESYNLLGEIYLALQDPQQAIVVFTAGAHKFPYYSLLSLNLGSVLASTGKHKEALQWYYNIIDKTTYYPQVYYYLSVSLIYLKEYREAEDVIEKGISHYPNDIRLYFLLSDIYRAQNKLQEEKNCYLLILKIDSKNREAMFQIARVLASEGLYTQALTYANQAKELNHPQADLLIELINSNIKE